MSGPSSTVKSIQKRFYALPRPIATRSLYTSILPYTFFEPPPPSNSSRPSNVIPTKARMLIEGRGEVESGQASNSSAPFALSSSYHSISPALATSCAFLPTPRSSVSNNSTAQTASESGPASRKQKQRYQLDVGAYGIPKSRHRRSLHTSPAYDDAHLAVGVGEDAYFIRNNAMGVADGVGGWARTKHAGSSSPSAVFAKHLMHYCSAEIESCSLPPSPSHTPHRSQSPIPLYDPWHWSQPYSQSAYELELEEQLEDSLEELEDGIDILMILEHAYQKTLDAHVVEEPSHHQPPPSIPLSCSAPSSLSIPNPLSEQKKPVPLLAGSSTVLLAVLDHVPRHPNSESEPTHVRGLKPSPNSTTEYDAVIKVAHVGDCMGMLVRGEQVVWRSEEMWWSFNTPVQLGPSSSATPSSSAHVFTLPVEADDILILASDGLSDNLWDEDILDEVVRFRRNYLKTSSPSNDTATSASERILWRRTLAGLLSEALCSRARRVSERKNNLVVSVPGENGFPIQIEDEVPFARRAREQGRSFKGGKGDDISVIVAVISPVADLVSVNESESCP